MTWQDIILSVCNAGFAVALIPAVRKKQPPHVMTCAMTAAFLAVIAGTYLTLSLWYAAGMTALESAIWIILMEQRIKQDTEAEEGSAGVS